MLTFSRFLKIFTIARRPPQRKLYNLSKRQINSNDAFLNNFYYWTFKLYIFIHIRKCLASFLIPDEISCFILKLARRLLWTDPTRDTRGVGNSMLLFGGKAKAPVVAGVAESWIMILYLFKILLISNDDHNECYFYGLCIQAYVWIV